MEQAWSFTALDTTKSHPNAFLKFLKKAVTLYAKNYFPSRFVLTGRHIDSLYESVSERVFSHLKSALSDGYGTVIFDGWSDATGASVVNVLIRTEGSGLASARKTFFLESVFTSHEKVGAEGYVRIVEDVMRNFGGMSRECAVTKTRARVAPQQDIEADQIRGHSGEILFPPLHQCFR